MPARPAGLRLLALGLAIVALSFAAWGLWRLNTWYLASDQFAFLTFARDLRAGTIFHPDETLELISPEGRRGALARDALAQTYFWRDGRLYSRYPPGFPALLAVAGIVGGEVGEHALNPVLYLLTLVVLAGLTWTLVRARVPTQDSAVDPAAEGASRLDEPDLAAGAAVAAMWILLLLPTQVHLWGITVVRDLPAHLLALLALLAAVRGRMLWCGAALGAACTVRPDAILYATSLAAVVAVLRPSRRSLLGAVLALVAASSPLWLYNLATEGSILRFTQGGEFRDLLGSLPPEEGIVLASDSLLHSGGAFRLANLPMTLPRNVLYLAGAFGWFTLLIAVAVTWAWRRRPLLVAALVPYPVVALLFYSCWSHPDTRYLAGAAACLVPLAATGACVTARTIVAAGGVARSLVLALAALLILRELGWLGALGGFVPAAGRAATAVAVGFALLASVRFFRARTAALAVCATLVPAFALAVVGGTLVARSAALRDSFQAKRVEASRRAVAEIVPRGSLVITSTSLGRPVENLRHYSGVEAFYAEELPLLGINAEKATLRFVLAGRRVFFLLDARDRSSLARLAQAGEVRERGRRGPARVLDWYVDPRKAPRGAVLYEVEIPEERQRQYLEYLRGAERGRRRERGLAPEPDVGLPEES
ncbi:MAG: hypothetical protein FJ144_04915 [Deltaproteobacteria bacterium]|nr:hypothetical protein [Deltaproteobacteria bacterium]